MQQHTQTASEKMLDLIHDSPLIQTEIAFWFPELKDYISSFIADRNCSCKNTIIKYLFDNRDTPAYKNMSLTLAQYLTADNTVEDTSPKPAVSINKREMFGEVEVIPSTREAYRNLIKRAKEEQWVFHGFTVTETKRKWKVFFY
jgi:hypothetical protein